MGSPHVSPAAAGTHLYATPCATSRPHACVSERTAHRLHPCLRPSGSAMQVLAGRSRPLPPSRRH
eukprot:8462172-Prorocentrum_lima.AAC.1